MPQKGPKEYTETERIHNDHVKEHKVPCSPCHNEIRHSWNEDYVQNVLPERDIDVKSEYLNKASSTSRSPGPNGPSDRSTDEGPVFSEVNYKLQKEVYRGTGGKGHEGSPDPMYLATVNCTACHKNKDLSVAPKTCNICHVKGFDKTMREQKAYIKEMLKILSGLLIESQRKGTPENIITEVRYNYNLIVSDGSYGVHNIKYVKDLIAYCITRLGG